MTAIAGIASGARGRLVVDAAEYDSAGIMLGMVAKAVTLPHLASVVATRGATSARWHVARELEAFPDFDTAVAGLADALHEAHIAGLFLDDGGRDDFDVALMGWSPARRRVELYGASSVAHVGLEPFRLHRLDVLLAPMPTDDALRAIGLKVGASFDLSRPAEKLAAVIEVQRRTPAPLGAYPDAPMGYGVGAAAVLTEVTEAAIMQRVIRRWPDVVGCPLIPDGAHEPPARPRPQLRVVA